jgi:hypothetical protein
MQYSIVYLHRLGSCGSVGCCSVFRSGHGDSSRLASFGAVRTGRTIIVTRIIPINLPTLHETELIGGRKETYIGNALDSSLTLCAFVQFTHGPHIESRRARE